ncbi:ATP-binding cassette sub-family B member 9 [Heptranchias perlo]|uniref:ATP-binding cassette sub-family B member 9 n=1 Tax=Heptranchias perlo TaxID=212740 RepID=UPI00355939C4
MRAWKVVTCTLVCMSLDISATTVFYVHGTEWDRFISDTINFDIFCSFLDVWAMVVLRFCLLFGAMIGVCLNTTYGPVRVKASKSCVSVACLVMVIYATVKMLLYSEMENFSKDFWFWCLFAWTCISSPAVCLLWHLLSSVKAIPELSINSEVGSDEEKKHLLSDNSQEMEDAKNDVSSGATIGKLLVLSKPDAGLLAVAFFFLLVAVIGETFIPFFVGKVIDVMVIQKNLRTFSGVIFNMALLAIVSAGSAGVRGGLFTLSFARLNIRIRGLLFKSLLRQEIGFFDCNHTGDITSRLTSDTTVVSNMISQNINIFSRNLVKSVGMCVFMFTLSWKLSVVTLLGFPVVVMVSKLYGKYYKGLARQVQDALGKANNIAEETMSSMKTLRSFATEQTELKLYKEKLHDVYKLNKKEALAYACYTWSSSLIGLSVQVAILYYGGYLVVSDHMTGGSLISFIIYELELGDSLENIGSVYTGLMQGVGAAEKVFEYMNRQPSVPNSGTFAPEKLTGEVTFRNVSFAYPTRLDTQVLKNVSFTLRPGEITALVGPSGSGKSSCVQLLENFYTPQAGEILLDDHPVQEYDHQYLHSKVAVVGQEPVLFARSIQENISYGLQECSMDLIEQASQMANAHGFITELKDGYDTETGEKGTQLSGGQKQRVAIARALVRDPRVLLLDEATSALDAESEYNVHQALCKLKDHCTILIVAHRLSTVEKAQNIIVIDKGTVVEQGTHEELMRKGNLYFKLVQRQILGLETGTGDYSPALNHSGKTVSGGVSARGHRDSDEELEFRDNLSIM